MPDYKKMYYTLFNEMTRAIEILQKAQQDAEEIYIESSLQPTPPIIKLVVRPDSHDSNASDCGSSDIAATGNHNFSKY